MDEQERQDLLEELLRALDERGVPAGAWVVEIDQARDALAGVDELLRRLRSAILRGSGSSTGWCAPAELAELLLDRGEMLQQLLMSFGL